MSDTSLSIENSTADKTARERLRDELAAANTHTDNPEAQRHVDRAIALVDDLPPTPLVECPVCKRVGLPERIEDHDCESGHVH